MLSKQSCHNENSNKKKNVLALNIVVTVVASAQLCKLYLSPTLSKFKIVVKLSIYMLIQKCSSKLTNFLHSLHLPLIYYTVQPLRPNTSGQ